MSKNFKIPLYIFITLFTVTFVADKLISLSGLDVSAFRSHFYYVEGDYFYEDDEELYQAIDDPEILYGMLPSKNVVCKNCLHPAENLITEVKVGTTNKGYRKTLYQPKEYTKKIVFVGGSNTYGASVSDAYTVTSLLQEKLNKYKSDTYRVENLGMNALVASQKVEIVKKYILKNGMPDIIFFQDSNKTRRAFFYKDDTIKEKMTNNSILYNENYPSPTKNNLGKLIFNSLARHSSLYRITYGVVTQFIISKYSTPDCNMNNYWNAPDSCVIVKLMKQINGFGIEFSDYKLSEFIAEFGKKIKIIMIYPTQTISDCKNGSSYLYEPYYEMPLGSTYRRCGIVPSEEYSHIHPPTHVYKWYAQNYFEFLRKDLLVK